MCFVLIGTPKYISAYKNEEDNIYRQNLKIYAYKIEELIFYRSRRADQHLQETILIF